jgi:DNA replication protein DnaC
MPPFVVLFFWRAVPAPAEAGREDDLRGRLCGAGGMIKTASDTMPTGTMSGKPQVLLAHHLKQLKLPTVLREYEKVARECAREDHPRYLFRLIELELIDRERRTVERRIRAARFPAVKSFDTFDFTAIPSLNKMLVLELARSEYILRRENIIALGNSGTGKTHVALALGLAACQKVVAKAAEAERCSPGMSALPINAGRRGRLTGVVL